jgi:hypothetical protein
MRSQIHSPKRYRPFLAGAAVLLAGLIMSAQASAGWTPPTFLSSATVEVVEPPEVAIDADGDATVVWINKQGTVQARTRSAAGRLGPVQTISQLVGDPALQVPPAEMATVGANARGDVLFAWVSRDFSDTQNLIVGRTRSPSGRLGPIQTLYAQSSDLGEILNPQVALDAEGDAVIAWEQFGGATNDLVRARGRAVNGTLGGVKTVSSPLGDAFFPQLEMDAGGEAVFVWEQITPPNPPQVQTRVLSPSGELKRITSLVDDLKSGEPSLPELALESDGGGDAVFAWQHTDLATGESIFQARTLSDAGVLGRTRNVSAGKEVADLQVDLAGDGDAVFAWQTKDGLTGKSLIEARTLSAGGALGRTKTLSDPTYDAFDPQVGVDADGDTVFAWQSNDGVNDLVKARSISAAGALRPAVNVASFADPVSGLRLAVAADGDAAAAWENHAAKRIEAAFGP